ncbi:MAG TPA: glycoside hydrolase family 95 protein, partial [Oscillospiraceae bacterium]|nr:glycoside hydrolase family 95 protein [Oscillospiraceae bacterium]
MKSKLMRIVALALVTAIGFNLVGCDNGKESSEEEIVKLPEITNVLRLWYDEPTPEKGWENASLPIGNGYMGLGIFGTADKETLVLNEKTLWTGGPSEWRPNYIGGNKQVGTYSVLEQIRAALAANDKEKVASLADELTGAGGDGYGAYQLMGHIQLNFEGINPEEVTDYVRDLNITESLAGVSFKHGGFTYTREYLANYPSNVIAIKLTTDNTDGMTFNVGMNSRQKDAVVTINNDTLTYGG